MLLFNGFFLHSDHESFNAADLIHCCMFVLLNSGDAPSYVRTRQPPTSQQVRRTVCHLQETWPLPSVEIKYSTSHSGRGKPLVNFKQIRWRRMIFKCTFASDKDSKYWCSTTMVYRTCKKNKTFYYKCVSWLLNAVIILVKQTYLSIYLVTALCWQV